MPTLFQAPTSVAPSPKRLWRVGDEVPTGKPANKLTKKSVKLETRSRMSPLTAFAVNPHGVRFETQEAEEHVALFLRQHLIVNVPWIAVIIVFLLVPSVLFPLILRSLPAPLPFAYILIGTLSWYLVTVGFGLVSFLHWFFNIYIVTNERIIDIDFQYLLFKRFSQAELERIQDISYTAGGIFATVFHYGNVYVQTAGEMPNLEFLAVPRPDKVVEKIRALTENLPGSL